MYNYFPHPSNLRQSSACVSLLIGEGFAGYGIYISILEVLRDAPRFRYSSDPRVWAYVLHVADIDQVARVLANYGLFDQDDDGLLFSPWLSEQLSEYSEKKTKLQEAGRRGAAKRWAAAHRENGQAIATSSLEDGQAIAYNDTQYNVTLRDETKPIEGGVEDWRSIVAIDSPKVDAEYLGVLADTAAAGHAPGFVAQVCMQFGMTVAVCDFICERSNNAEMSHPTYKKFCAIVRRIQQEKWSPKHPSNFFLSKLFE